MEHQRWNILPDILMGVHACVRCTVYTNRYAYGTGEENPGQLKVHLGQVPVDGDYWIAALGPATFGPDGLYEWSIVTGP